MKGHSLITFLKETLPEEVLESEPGSYMVHLFDLETWTVRQTEAEASSLIQAINFERELLFRTFPFFLFFWTDPFSRRKVQRFAMDFWDWLPYEFSFYSQSEALSQADQEAQLKGSWLSKTRDPARAHRIARLREAYLQVEDKTSPQARQQALALGERLADEYYLLPDYERAIEFFQRGLKLLGKIRPIDQAKEALFYRKMGESYKEKGAFPEALLSLVEDVRRSEELYASNPHSESLKNGLAISYSKLGGIYEAQGQLSEALKYYEQRSQLGEELYASNPHSESLKNGLAISYSKLGGIY
ncbi:MAG: hypothetical protein AAFR61_29875, partial [Bacteroidota bacterium]